MNKRSTSTRKGGNTSQKQKFSGSIILKQEGEEDRVIDVDLPNLEDSDSIHIKFGQDCTAGASIQASHKEKFARRGFTVSFWGTVPCTREQFENGDAHQLVVDHLIEHVDGACEGMMESWIK